MTDRLHSCKDSPDGRHHSAPTGQTPPRFTCRYCAIDLAQSAVAVMPAAGWNAPAIDPDAHLGAVE